MNAEISNNKKLPELNKRTVAVLSETEMMDVNGGTTVICFAIASSEMCATGAAAATVVLYQIVVGG